MEDAVIEAWPLFAAIGVLAAVVICACAAAHDHEKLERRPESSFDL